MLDVIEYVGIYLKKGCAEYARILNVSDAVHKVTEQIIELLPRQ